jgi:NitT/TauT family transport system substrate-binding protein
MTALTRAAQTLLFAAALMLATASHAAETIIAGGLSSASANLWPVYVGIKKGFFADVDIKIDLIFSQSNTATIQQLVVNAINLSIGSGLVDPIRAIEKGAPLAIARIEALRPPYALVSKSGIREMNALTGKIVSVGGAKDIMRIFLERMLIRAGVDPKGVDLIFAGATSARLAAMQSGAADAAMLTTPYNFHAIAADLPILASPPTTSTCRSRASRPTATGPRTTSAHFGNSWRSTRNRSSGSPIQITARKPSR